MHSSYVHAPSPHARSSPTDPVSKLNTFYLGFFSRSDKFFLCGMRPKLISELNNQEPSHLKRLGYQNMIKKNL